MRFHAARQEAGPFASRSWVLCIKTPGACFFVQHYSQLRFKEEPIKYKDTTCGRILYIASICVSIYGVISILLLPLTVQVITDQYGEVRIPNGNDRSTGHIMTLTDMPIVLEVFLISLFFLANLFGFYSVIKRSVPGLGFYSFVRMVELGLSACWLTSVGYGDVKSHVMSQWSLGWHCFAVLVIETICATIVSRFLQYELDHEEI